MILLISRPNYAIALISEFSIITDATPVAIMTVYCLFTINAGKLFHFPHDSQDGSVIITGSRVGKFTLLFPCHFIFDASLSKQSSLLSLNLQSFYSLHNEFRNFKT